jgi:hypothetical protein
MSFKKYSEFISEKEDQKDIIEVKIPTQKNDPSVSLKCPKCGSSRMPCECYIDDYYDAEISQQTPKPQKTKKGNPNGKA